MDGPDETEAGHLCWIDLAAADAGAAVSFYSDLFGWSAQDRQANGGTFIRLHLDGRDVGSLYQLGQAAIEGGMPSHWTPYIRVDDVDDTVERAVGLGGEAVAPPFVVTGVARIALIRDCVGAHIGLWAPERPRG